jgi:hypothetical protein
VCVRERAVCIVSVSSNQIEHSSSFHLLRTGNHLSFRAKGFRQERLRKSFTYRFDSGCGGSAISGPNRWICGSALRVNLRLSWDGSHEELFDAGWPSFAFSPPEPKGKATATNENLLRKRAREAEWERAGMNLDGTVKARKRWAILCAPRPVTHGNVNWCHCQHNHCFVLLECTQYAVRVVETDPADFAVTHERPKLLFPSLSFLSNHHRSPLPQDNEPTQSERETAWRRARSLSLIALPLRLDCGNRIDRGRSSYRRSKRLHTARTCGESLLLFVCEQSEETARNARLPVEWSTSACCMTRRQMQSQCREIGESVDTALRPHHIYLYTLKNATESKSSSEMEVSRIRTGYSYTTSSKDVDRPHQTSDACTCTLDNARASKHVTNKHYALFVLPVFGLRTRIEIRILLRQTAQGWVQDSVCGYIIDRGKHHVVRYTLTIHIVRRLYAMRSVRTAKEKETADLCTPGMVVCSNRLFAS